MNENIANGLKKVRILYYVFITFQVITIVIMGLKLKEDTFFFGLILGAFFLYLLIDILIYFFQIHKRKKLLNVLPIRCILEDFVVSYYSKKKFDVYPIVKDSNNNLYFPYHNVSNYATVYTTVNYKYNFKIIRKDKSELKIGDTVYLYKDKDLDVNVKIEKNTVKIYKNKISNLLIKYNHHNDNYDIDVFNKMIYYEGAIEIEKNI